MATQTRPDFFHILQTLQEHGVAFIVVGGVAAVLHGAPLTTFDLDLVHSRTPENLDRLVAALSDLGAFYRGHGDKRILPRSSHLRSDGHHLLMTDAGPLDLLGVVGLGETFESLVSRTVVVLAGGELQIRVVDLDTLIELKEHAGRDKDLAALPVLRATAAEKKRRG